MFHIIVDGEYHQDAEGMWAWPAAEAQAMVAQVLSWGFEVELEPYEEQV